MTAFKHGTRTMSFLAAALFLGVALAGCVSQDAQAASGELYVKDALTDEAAEVHVTFTKAEVLAAQAQAWATVYEGEQSIELLSLSGPDDKAKLADFELEPGAYDRLRITVSNVTVVDHDGTEHPLAAFGNVVTIAHGINVDANGNFEALVDFDLEKGVDLENGTYVPVVGYAQTTHKDDAGNAEDTDRTDAPEQNHAVDERGLFGLCTAWDASEMGRENGTAANGTAFTWLQDQAAAENATVEAYCEEAARPGAPSRLSEVLPDQMPEQARAYLQDRALGPPQDAEDRRQSGEDARMDRSDADERGAAGNDTRDRDAAENRSAQEDRDQANQTSENRTAEDGNRTQEDSSEAGNESEAEDQQP